MIAYAQPGPIAAKRSLQRQASISHERFLHLMPAIRRHAHIVFRHLGEEAKSDAVEETLGLAFVAYARLVERGKEELAYAAPLARYAVAHYRAGRRVGSRLNTHDLSSSVCQRRAGISMRSLDDTSQHDPAWQDILVEDRRATPADIAASRIDFAAFLATLDSRVRQIAETLATGESTSCTAAMFSVSLGRISQIRKQLRDAWDRFHLENGREGALQ